MAIYKATSATEMQKIAGVTETTGGYNPNLLVNGDFQVWQRGEEFSITNNGKYNYTADMWRVYGGSVGTVTKTSDGLRLTGNNPLQQVVELKNGKAYTLSSIINGQLHTLTFIAGTSKENDALAYRIDKDRIIIKCENRIDVEWVKLEQGAITTANIKEDYYIVLLRCLPFLQVYKTNGSGYIGTVKKMSETTGLFIIPLVYPMVANPTIISSGVNAQGLAGIEYKTVNMCGNTISGTCTTSSSAPNAIYYIQLVNDKSYFILSCEPT